MIELTDKDKYETIENSVRTEIKIKGSKFISTVIPVKSIEEADRKLHEIRHEFYDATHNCFSYKLGFKGEPFRYSDDGEPSGSAGKPIYFTLTKYALSDILVVVTRYFGGTKLGVGGLVRAYSDSAEESLKIVKRKIIHITSNIMIECDYTDISLIKKLIDKYAIKFSEEYTDRVKYNIQIPISRTEEFPQIVYELSEGKIKAKLTD